MTECKHPEYRPLVCDECGHDCEVIVCVDCGEGIETK
jgi:hypothetical protein